MPFYGKSMALTDQKLFPLKFIDNEVAIILLF